MIKFPNPLVFALLIPLTPLGQATPRFDIAHAKVYFDEASELSEKESGKPQEIGRFALLAYQLDPAKVRFSSPRIAKKIEICLIRAPHPKKEAIVQQAHLVVDQQYPAQSNFDHE